MPSSNQHDVPPGFKGINVVNETPSSGPFPEPGGLPAPSSSQHSSPLWAWAWEHPDHRCYGLCPDYQDEGSPGPDSRDPLCRYCDVLSLVEQHEGVVAERDEFERQRNYDYTRFSEAKKALLESEAERVRLLEQYGTLLEAARMLDACEEGGLGGPCVSCRTRLREAIYCGVYSPATESERIEREERETALQRHGAQSPAKRPT